MNKITTKNNEFNELILFNLNNINQKLDNMLSKLDNILRQTITDNKSESGRK